MLTLDLCLQTTKPPAKLKKQTVYFMKPSKTDVTLQNIDSTVRRLCLAPASCTERDITCVGIFAQLCTCISVKPKGSLPQDVDKPWLGQVLWGDFGEAPIEALAGFSQAVMLPLLSNPAVRAAWPETVAQDLTAHMHKFLSAGVAPTAG